MERPERRERAVAIVHLLLVLALLVAQAAYSARSASQLRYEEAAESVRNPLWLSHGLLYDPVSSNVGWYATLLAVYEVFGFSLHAGKIVRVVLQAASLGCATVLLLRALGPRRAWIPLVAFALSPVLLHMNSMQASFGIDAQCVPICLLLVCGGGRARAAAGWALAMLAWMSFPSMAFALPAIALAHCARPREEAMRTGGAAAIGFLAPLLLAVSLIPDRGDLLRGLFRGGGGGEGMPPALANLRATLGDLVGPGATYHYEVPAGDLFGIVPLFGFAAAAAGAVMVARRGSRTERFAAAGIASALALNLAGILIAHGPPGARRVTVAVTAACALLALGLRFIARSSVRGWIPRVVAGAAAVVPLHHLAVFPGNLRHVSDPSPYAEPWYASAGTPQATLDRFVDRARGEGLKLGCAEDPYCRLQEIYAGVAASCRFDDLPCKPVVADDPRVGRDVALSPAIWETGYWER